MVILIFVVLSLLAVILVVPAGGRPTPTGRMDWWGAAVLSLSLICMTYFVSHGASAGWLAPVTLAYLVGTLVSFTSFWMIEKRRASPLIAVRHLRSRQVWPVIISTILTLSGIFAVINFTVVLLGQNAEVGYGLDAATSALFFLAPAALIGVAAAPLSGWLADKQGWIRILRIGLVLSLLALVVIAVIPTHQGAVIACVAVLGITYNGLVLTTINGLGVLLSPSEAPAALPGLNGAGFGIGASLGIAIVAPFTAAGTLDGFTTALWVSIAITGLALGASLLIRPRPGQKL